MAGTTRPRWVDTVTAILLSTAGLSTAWASYQASLWSGNQVSHYSEANALLTQASQLDIQVGQRAAFDMAVFVAWTGASNAGQVERAGFLERRFSEPFLRALAEWRRGLAGDATAASPEVPQPLYPLAAEASSMRASAAQAFAAAESANRIGSRFVATTVLLSTVLFLAGISQVLAWHWPRLCVLGLASLIFIGALGWLARLPAVPM